MKIIRLFLLAIASLSVIACATTYKLYEGPARPDTEVATIIKDGYHIRVDGHEISPKTLGDKIIKVLPGEHKVETVYTKGFSLEWHWYEMDVTLEPGKSYAMERVSLLRTDRSLDKSILHEMMELWSGKLIDPPDRWTFFWVSDLATGEVIGGYRPERRPDGLIYAIPEKGVEAR